MRKAGSRHASPSIEGLERAPQGLIALLKGQNIGKQLVKLA